MRFVWVGVIMAASLNAAAKLKMQDLPPAVQNTVREQLKGATLVRLAREVEDGKTVYEVETKVNGHTRDLMVDGAGAILEVEEEVALDKVPADARAAIEKRAQGGKIRKVETVTKDGKISYEADIVKGRKATEITVGADGSVQK